MVSKHKIEMVLTWYQRGYDVQLIAHHLGLDPWASDNYQYDDGYTSGLAQALAIIESHLKGNK